MSVQVVRGWRSCHGGDGFGGVCLVDVESLPLPLAFPVVFPDGRGWGSSGWCCWWVGSVSSVLWSLDCLKACQASGICGVLLELACFGGGVDGGGGLDPPMPMKVVLMMSGLVLSLAGRLHVLFVCSMG